MDLLWTDFLNSEWHDWRGSGRSEDRMDKPEWMQHFIEKWQLPAPFPPEPAHIAALKELRALLRFMVEALAAGVAPTNEDVHELNMAMAAGPITRRIVTDGEAYRIDMNPVRNDWAQAMAEIAASFARTLVEGEGARIRICENRDCLWIYYDETRNRSKRFCDDKMCGNLMKVRRFRARKKAETDGRQ